MQGSAETVVEQVADDFVTDRVLGAVGADDRNAAWLHQPLERSSDRLLVPAGESARGATAPVGSQDDVLQVPFWLHAHGVAGALEDGQHHRIRRQDVSLEHRDADPPTGDGQRVEQHRAEALPLKVVLDREGHVGVVASVDAQQARRRDDRVVVDRHQCEMVKSVHVDELAKQLATEPRHRSQQPLGERLTRQPATELQQQLLVIRTRWPHKHRSAVAQESAALVGGREFSAVGHREPALATGRTVRP